MSNITEVSKPTQSKPGQSGNLNGLAQHEYVADAYSIADLAIWPWVSRYEWQTVDLNAYPNVKRRYISIASRPAMLRGYNVPWRKLFCLHSSKPCFLQTIRIRQPPRGKRFACLLEIDWVRGRDRRSGSGSRSLLKRYRCART